MPQGHLRITASVTFGRIALATDFERLSSKQYPQHRRLDDAASTELVNLVEEGIDAGIRIGRLPDSSLVARRVGKVRRILVASPGYLTAHVAFRTIHRNWQTIVLSASQDFSRITSGVLTMAAKKPS